MVQLFPEGGYESHENRRVYVRRRRRTSGSRIRITQKTRNGGLGIQFACERMLIHWQKCCIDDDETRNE